MNQREFSKGIFTGISGSLRIRAWRRALKAPRPSGARVCTAGPPHGKHRLLSLTEAVDGELPWVRMFYDVRIEAEGLENWRTNRSFCKGKPWEAPAFPCFGISRKLQKRKKEENKKRCCKNAKFLIYW